MRSAGPVLVSLPDRRRFVRIRQAWHTRRAKPDGLTFEQRRARDREAARRMGAL